MWYLLAGLWMGLFLDWPIPLWGPLGMGVYKVIDFNLQAVKLRETVESAGAEKLEYSENASFGDRLITQMLNGRPGPIMYLWAFAYGTILTLVISMASYLVRIVVN